MFEAKQRDGIWYKVGTVNGRQVRRSLKLPRGTAKAVAEQIIALENARLVKEQVFGTKAVITFSDAALFYMRAKGEEYFRKDKSAARQLKILIQELGQKKMAEITGSDLADLAQSHYPRCKPQSRKRFVYTWVNAIYRMNAIAERCDLKIFKAPGVPKDKPVEPASEDWIAKFTERAYQRGNTRLAALVFFMTFTAARVSEAIRVAPEDIEQRGGELWVNLRMTKPGVARYVKLHQVVVSALAQLDMEPGKAIFGYSSRRSVNKAIYRICDDANLKYYSSHKVGRHSFAKRFLDNGYTLAMLQGAGGWLSMGAVNRNYKHLEKSHEQDAVATISTNLAQSLTKNGENAKKSTA